ncbi:oleate hydratase [butyrate-producing bacterium]|jgi:oleate hydratase|uniref:oleate hydratase n=1 Tax=Clostridium sp. AM34-11AC TaxID=2305242 RepID=UPI000E42A88A|nr:oleate hydratase [Clostridium sp. AM34-11AC]MBS7201501.1 oleate hydratase [butyrate-producing bacterium]RGE07892.1 oleate hydratase [Clostridium sp. AM34-11AC]
MSKKGWKAGAVLAAGAGITAVLAAKKRGNMEMDKMKKTSHGSRSDYRNTELGKHDKNSKGIYYTNGNYEAFARPEKPAGIEEKSAYLVGSGLASLAAACFLVRDAQMPGKNIHILEAMDIAGGACDGIDDPTRGYVMRGGREMEDHFECLWDLFHSIPSLEVPGASVLDEYYWLNKHDPNYSLCRATERRGEDAHTDGKFGLSQKGSMEIMKLFFTKDEDLYDKTIEDVFDDEVFGSQFWLYWRTMFAFENWHSALEMKRYFQRFIHHIGGLPDFSALKFTRYNQYESLILPMQKYLEAAGVEFRFGTEVTNVRFEITDGKKTARAIECRTKNGDTEIPLTEKDLVFITNGSCTEGTIYGDQNHAPVGDAEVRSSGCWSLWKKIAAQDPSFGHPEKFCSDIEKTNWESATVTTANEEIIDQIKKICKRDPRTGKVVTGGIVSCRDSKWLLSWTINRQGQFKNQKKDEVCVWVYSLFTDVPGDYVKKPMKECTGKEITAEWLYHLGIPVEDIERLSGEECNCTPTMMPYITAFFMPRSAGDRPDVIPDGSVNAAFLGQFAETPRDTIFTTEYSVRTAMEAVYGLCGVDRGVPEVWGSVYDVRELLDSTVKLMDGKSPLEMKLPMPFEMLKKPLLRKIDKTIVGKLLRDHDVLKDWML